MDVDAAPHSPGWSRCSPQPTCPVNEYGLTMFDQPVLIGLGDTGRAVDPRDVSRWEADKIALVVAETLRSGRRRGGRHRGRVGTAARSSPTSTPR